MVQPQQQLPERAPSVRVLGREPHHLAVALRRLLVAPVGPQRLRERRVRAELIRIRRDRPPHHPDALFGLPERQVPVPRAHERRHRIHPVSQRVLVGLHRPAGVALGREHIAEEQRRAHVRRVNRRAPRAPPTPLHAPFFERNTPSRNLEQDVRVLRPKRRAFAELLGARGPRVRRPCKVQLRDPLAQLQIPPARERIRARQHRERVSPPAHRIVRTTERPVRVGIVRRQLHQAPRARIEGPSHRRASCMPRRGR